MGFSASLWLTPGKQESRRPPARRWGYIVHRDFFAALPTKSAMKCGNAKAPTRNSGVQYWGGKRPALA
jgi:hypothetical protein